MCSVDPVGGFLDWRITIFCILGTMSGMVLVGTDTSGLTVIIPQVVLRGGSSQDGRKWLITMVNKSPK